MIEGALRIAGLWLEAQHQHEVSRALEKGSTVRILVIGDSISKTSPAEAWPEILEARLKALGWSAQVINEAQYGTSTALVLGKLGGYLAKYHPQIVISMVGAADPLNLWHRDSDNPFIRGLGNLRVARIFLRLMEALSRHPETPAQHFGPGESASDMSNPLAGKIIALIEKNQLKEASVLTERAIENYDRKAKARFLQHIAMKIQPPLGTQLQRMKVAFSYQKKSLENSLDIPFGVELGALYAYFAQEFEGCLQILQMAKAGGVFLSDGAITYAARCAKSDAQQVTVADSLGRDSAVEVEFKRDESPTAYHYRALSKMIQESGAIHIAMQYPNVALGSLQAYFTGAGGSLSPEDKIVFLDNEKNFQIALRGHPRSEIFTDALMPDYGHLTVRGHQMVAEIALKGIMALSERQKKTKRE